MANSLRNIDDLININLYRIYDAYDSNMFWLDFQDREGNNLDDGVAKRVAKVMEEKGLVTIEPTKGYRCDITDFGIQIMNTGGWLDYIESLKETSKNELEREKKKDELLELDLKLRRFESRIGKKIIVAGIIITVLSFLLSLLTSEIKISRELKKTKASSERLINKSPIEMTNDSISR